ncbi:hypothetical protein BOW86_gp119 [Synechococcus phage S-CAM7]|uniref:Uncharacterized protein n=1 Tax=Synechococcus phage S-CAM7 TaxID=1883368 RepID=A0A1D8KTQ1_9CAUD|nr:hypothetical protein BOW86_gp119 [Synechococcus phage S-CAM7]AOV62043.1 hypothetical protein C490910_119 [Synechococcus phage S-CAM7]
MDHREQLNHTASRKGGFFNACVSTVIVRDRTVLSIRALRTVIWRCDPSMVGGVTPYIKSTFYLSYKSKDRPILIAI